LFGWVWSMLNLAGLMGKYKDLCQGLWAECTNTTKMENLVTKLEKDPSFCCFYKHNPMFLNSLHIFVEIAIVHNAQKLHSKLANQEEH